MTTLTANGNTYNDGIVPPNNMGNGGHRSYLLPMLTDVIVDLATKQAAAEAAAISAIAAPGTNASSTTSLAIGTGSKSLTIQTGKAFVVGQWVLVTSSASPANWMAGYITSYTSGTGALVVTVTHVGGSGTIAAWNVTLVSPMVFANLLFTNSTFTNYTETLYTPAAASAFTVDLANGTLQKLTTNANCTITLPSSVAGKSFALLVAYGGAHTITWAGGSTIKWPNGSAPAATSVSGKFDLFVFTCDGTNTYARSGGSNF